jgi:transposase
MGKSEGSRAMKEFIALDAHKRYSWMEREEVRSRKVRQARIDHFPGAIRQSLEGRETGTAVAVEATGNWYWIVDEIEQAGLEPRLVHPRKAKLMMGMINKTDKLDAHGMNQLQRNGTLPTVWIPPRELRDLREITRARMVLTGQRTRLKNRVQATLNKYGLVPQGEASDPFGKKARLSLEEAVQQLPLQTAQVTQMLLRQLDFIEQQIQELEKKIRGLVKDTAEMERLRSQPGIGWILSAVIALEVGDMSRFASAERYASYAGTTPATGGRGWMSISICVGRIGKRRIRFRCIGIPIRDGM